MSRINNIEHKHKGRFKLVYDLANLLVKERIYIDKEWEKFIYNILKKKYQDNKTYYLDDKI